VTEDKDRISSVRWSGLLKPKKRVWEEVGETICNKNTQGRGIEDPEDEDGDKKTRHGSRSGQVGLPGRKS